jgi:hypothetical protein
MESAFFRCIGGPYDGIRIPDHGESFHLEGSSERGIPGGRDHHPLRPGGTYTRSDGHYFWCPDPPGLGQEQPPSAAVRRST